MKEILKGLREFVWDAFNNIADGIHAVRWVLFVALLVVMMYVGISNMSQGLHTYDVMILNNDGNIVRSYVDVEAIRFRFTRDDDVILDAENGGVALYVEHTDSTQIVVKRTK